MQLVTGVTSHSFTHMLLCITHIASSGSTFNGRHPTLVLRETPRGTLREARDAAVSLERASAIGHHTSREKLSATVPATAAASAGRGGCS